MTLISQITEKTTMELSALPAKELQKLQEQVGDLSKQAAMCKDLLAFAVSLKYSDKASEIRQGLEKETGTIRFNDDDALIIANVQKKPKWDQGKLRAIAERIQASGENPAEFMTINYKVPESKYTAWPNTLKEQFAPARTLDFGKQTFSIQAEQESDV